jgi:predicted acyl esterase
MWGGRPGQSGRAGAWDQSEREVRSDVLSFASDILQQEIEITGPARIEVWAASSAESFDIVATLVDVYPDGKPINLCEGATRCDKGRSKILIEVDLVATSNVFFPVLLGFPWVIP